MYFAPNSACSMVSSKHTMGTFRVIVTQKDIQKASILIA